jgi:hypothetical protein
VQAAYQGQRRVYQGGEELWCVGSLGESPDRRLGERLGVWSQRRCWFAGRLGSQESLLAEVGFTEPDKHAGVAFQGQGGTELGAAKGVFEASAAGG